jgi:hypothetical protein
MLVIRFPTRIRAGYSPLEPCSKVIALTSCRFDRKDFANIYDEGVNYLSVRDQANSTDESCSFESHRFLDRGFSDQ